MRNPTLSDVAEAAGVSYATADRVVNARGNVAEKSIRKVSAAMEALGYVRDIAAANLSRGRTYRLGFLLPAGPNAFFAKMRAALDSQALHLAAERVNITVIEVTAFSHDRLREALAGLDTTALDGVAIVGLSGAGVEAALTQLRDQGVAVVSLVSDLPLAGRDAYVGINNLAAGRTAARLLGMTHRGTGGRVIMLAGSLEAEDHARRLAGFRAVIEADFPTIRLSDPMLTRDDAQQVFVTVENALTSDDAITGIYNAGAGNTGLIRAIQAHRQASPPICVAHELVPQSRAALEAGQLQFVIDQRPDIEVARAVPILRALIDGRPMPPMPDLVPMIYVPDNLPTATDSQTMKAPADD